MTKARLEQYADLVQEIKKLKKRIKNLLPEATADTVQSAADFPYSLHTVTIGGYDWEEYETKKQRLSRILEKRKQQAEAEQLEIEEFISSVQNSRVRQILTVRYIEGESWRRTSWKFNYRTESGARNIIDRYFKKTLKKT